MSEFSGEHVTHAPCAAHMDVARVIVNRLYELAAVSVVARQAVNDEADRWLACFLSEHRIYLDPAAIDEVAR